MKKILSFVLFVILALALSVTVFAGEEYLVESTLGSEKLTTREIKGIYVGQNFETTIDSVVGAKMFSKSGSIPDGMKLTGTWTHKNTYGDYVFSAVLSGKPTTAGTYNFTVNYLKEDEKTVVDSRNYSITVGEKAPYDYVISINVDKWPAKTEYYLGDTVDLTGMKVTAVAYTYDSKTKIYYPFQLDVTDLVCVEPTIAYSKELDEVVVYLKVPGNPQGELKTFNDSFQIKVVDKIIASGYCGGEGDGTNLEWTLTEDGVLTICGEGEMKDYGEYKNNHYYVNDSPWKDYRNEIKVLKMDEGITRIGFAAFYGCENLLGELIIPKSVKEIGANAFTKCTNLSGRLVIPENVTSIEGWAFSRCSGFTGELVIPQNVTYIGPSAFSNCEGFTGNIVIPEKITNIESYTFYGCTGFTGNIVIPDDVTQIGQFAFKNCTGLSGILIIPDKIKEIGVSTFYNCGINEYYFQGDAPQKNNYHYFDSIYPLFDVENDIIYYPKGNKTWELINDKWYGYTAVPYDTDAVIYGDIDGNGRVNVIDANLVRRYAAELIELDEKQLAAADVDGNGKVNVVDANLIRRYAANLIDKFPIEE